MLYCTTAEPPKCPELVRSERTAGLEPQRWGAQVSETHGRSHTAGLGAWGEGGAQREAEIARETCEEPGLLSSKARWLSLHVIAQCGMDAC